ncbi:MAG: DeoR/GlpR transcriptional regulator [Clostridia bacterium]|nr:DeoR/GlpR transcriptional regulator [Clostridia bacterium]
MFMEERQKHICDIIRQNGKITITEITEAFGISDESARRDLRILEQQGQCKRTRGGAIAMTQVSVRPAPDRRFDDMPIYPAYDKIAEKAASLVRENDILYLTGGSFGYIILRHLPRDIRYTIVTNSVDIGQKLRSFDNTDVYLAGGKMRQSGSLVDSLAVEFISRMHFDLCFLTGAGLTASFGLSNGTDETAAFQRAVLRNSREKILLMPGCKIGTDSFIKVCDITEFDTIITDWDCLDEHITSLKDMGVEVVVVRETA